MNKIRNFSIIAHIDHGKTTLSDRLLEFTQTISERERQDQLLDSMDLERERGITIKSHPVTMEYTAVNGKTYKLNLLDTPGHEDFSEDTYRTLTAVGSALMVLDAAKGVEDRTIKLMDVCRMRSTPIISFINKLDRTGANFFMCVDMIKERLGARPLVTQLPIGMEASLKGVVDLVKMKAVIWKDETLGAEFEVKDIPDDLKESANKYRQELVELAVEQDEKLMEDYLNGKEITESDLIKCIRKGTLGFNFVPITTGSAFKNKGVQPLLDAVVDYLPSPEDIGSIKGTKPGSDEELEMKFDDKAPFSALAFKVANDPFVGSLTFIRIYSGTVKSGTGIYNTSKDKEERVGRMLLMHANSRAVSYTHLTLPTKA